MKSTTTRTKVLFVVGIKNSGKTTLIEKLIGELDARGYRVGTVKHHHADSPIEIDRKGKDSWRHRRAGARAVALVSPSELAIMGSTDASTETNSRASFEKALEFLSDLDLVLVEGFSSEPGPRIEVGERREANPVPGEEDAQLFARVTRQKLPGKVPSFTPDETVRLVELIERRIIQRQQ